MVKPTIATLRALADEKGFTVERAIAKNAWRLVDAKGVKAVKENGSAAFSIEQGVKFLKAAKPPRGKSGGKT